jgi:hypothetical protein|tara:strand:- start:335 stop:529 length:195 start_codon:yes stop_codon:yes gene_type:complete
MSEYKKLTKERLKYIVKGAVSNCEESKQSYAKEIAIAYSSYCVGCTKNLMLPMGYDDWLSKYNK